MTKQELIDHLQHLEQYTHYSEDAPALREVIEMLKCSEMPNGSDAINRQDAIDALDKRFDSIPMEQTTEILLLRKDLRDLPTAEPKRIRGKWIYGEDSIADGVDGYRCDRCGFFVPWDYTHKSIDYINSYNYCPYCGADMRGGHDDQKTHDKRTEERTETHACDLISRQAAINAKQEFRNPNVVRNTEARTAYDRTYANGWNDCNSAWINAIKALPSAQPETAKRIVGKSRDGMTLWYQCNMCNEPVDAQDNFCRGCGRRLTDG